MRSNPEPEQMEAALYVKAQELLKLQPSAGYVHVEYKLVAYRDQSSIKFHWRAYIKGCTWTDDHGRWEDLLAQVADPAFRLVALKEDITRKQAELAGLQRELNSLTPHP